MSLSSSLIYFGLIITPGDVGMFKEVKNIFDYDFIDSSLAIFRSPQYKGIFKKLAKL